MKNNKVYINLHNKLILPEANASSRALFVVFYIALAINWFFVFLGLYPITSFLPMAVILLIEYKRKTSFTASAFDFALKRLYLHIFIIIATLFYMFFILGNISIENRAWFLLCYILIPLSLYDAYCTTKGGLGLSFIRPIKDAIRKRS